MFSPLRCLDCRNLSRPDVPDDFYCSNLRRCRATNRLHWIGDPAEQCSSFTFTKEDIHQ